MHSTSDPPGGHSLRFLQGGGELGALIRAFDWTSTPLGPIESWPQSLRTTVSLLLRAPGPMVLLWGWEGVLIYNDGYAKFAGRRHPDLLGVGAREGWPEIADFNDNIIRTVLAGTPISLKAQELVLDRAGSPAPAWLDLDYTPVPDESGAPAGVLVYVREITDRLVAERRAADEALRQRRMLQQMPGFAAVLSGSEHRFDYANDAYLELTGRRSVLGLTVREAFPDIAGQGFFELLDRVYESGERFSARSMPAKLSHGDRTIDLLYEPIRDDDGQVTGVFVGGYDVTEAGRTRTALMQSEARYRGLFDSIDAGFCVIEVLFDGNAQPFDYRFVEINPAFERQTGLANAVGRTIRDFTPDMEQYWFDTYGRVALTGEPTRFENRAEALGRWYDLYAFRVGEPEQRRVAVLFNDITERRSTERRRQALIDINDAFRDEADPDALPYRAAEAVGRALEADRVGYGVVDADTRAIRVATDWRRGGLPTAEGEHWFREYGDYADPLLAGKPVAIDDVCNDPRVPDPAPLKRFGVAALLDVPVTSQGRAVAQMFVHSATPRKWRSDEAEFVREVAERTRAEIARRSAERELAETTQQLRDQASELEAIFDAVPAAIWVARDAGATRIDGNEFARQLLRTPEGTNQSKTPADGAEAPSHFRVYDASGAETLPHNLPVQRAARGEEVTNYEETIVFDDGSSAVLVGNARPLFDARGEPRGAVASFIDITERRRVEAEVRAGEERYRTLFEAMDEGFCIIEFIDGPHGPLSDYVHVEANAAYAKNAGIPDVVGQKVREMVPAEADGWVDLYRTVLESGQPIRFEKELEATGRWLELAAFRVEPRSRNQVAVLFKDLTERKRAEVALRNSEENFRTLARVMPNQAWTAKPDGMLDWFNARVYDFSGAEPGSLDGEGWVGLVHPEDVPRAAARWAEAVRTGETYEAEFRLRRADGAWRWHIARAVAVTDGAGNLTRWIGTNTDIHDQKEITETLEQRVKERTSQLMQAEEALRQSQKMEAVGQLTGGIAHDFNNLLGGISGSLELLEKRISEGRLEGVQRYITSAQEASRRAASLTQRLLAFSRRQTLDPKPLDANKLVAGIEDLIRRTVGPTITVEVVGAGELWPTRADASQLENSLLNLCINARDAMAPDGGRLTIETANKWLDENAARERELPPGQYISICVTDTGAGMTPEVIARAFDPFFTTKPIGQGTGLGLSMVYGFVRQSNGQIRISSEIGKGTTMCLYLPRYFGKVEEAQAPEGDETIDRGDGETVLVIDDEPILRMLIIDVLEENGYRALEAIDGPSGLKILESDTRIDLLITDVGLPGGMNGRQVADAARVLRPDLKVLFVTGYAENAVVGNGHLDHGMEVLTKPFPVATLGQRIRSLIEG